MTTARIFIQALLILFACTNCFAQDFIPLIKDPAKTKSYTNAIAERCKKDIASINNKHKKEIADVYKFRAEYITEAFTENEVVTDPNASSYLAAITNEIIKNNPVLNASDLRIVFSNSSEVNAYSMGEGTIFFNIGLFMRLENESQVAFILCHEIAHFYLDHSNQKILKRADLLLSDEMQKKLKELQKKEYKKNAELMKLANDFTFVNRRHSREYEQAADSMAMVFMKNSGYDLSGAIESLQILEKAVKSKFDCQLNLPATFNFAQFPFKKSWLESDLIAFKEDEDVKEKSDAADSLKTHPDIDKRILYLKEPIEKYNKTGSKKFIISQEKFQQLQQQFDFAVIDYLLENEIISPALFYCLQMLKVHPKNIYLHTVVGKCLNEIYAKQKAHTLNRIVHLPGPHYDEEYNNLLLLIQNLRLREMASLAYYYLQQHKELANGNKDYEAELRKSIEIFNQ